MSDATLVSGPAATGGEAPRDGPAAAADDPIRAGHAVLRSAARFESALAGRLRAVAAVLLPAGARPAPGSEPASDAADLLGVLVDAVRADPTAPRAWLLYAGVTAALPTADEVHDALRVLALEPPASAFLWLLDKAVTSAADVTASPAFEVVTDKVLVEVDHTARNDLRTGVQRVVRQTLPRWRRDHDVLPVAWAASHCLRTLGPHERARVALPAVGPDRDPGTTLVVPWGTVVVLTEVPWPPASWRVASLAQCSGNAVVALGYDCIPATSADLVPDWERPRFARYLSAIKHCRRVAGISETAAEEFRGFVDTLAAQGLQGPAVVSCPLPSVPVEPWAGPGPSGVGARPVEPRPLVLGVGTFEPRKNQLGVLYAAELLWREGLDFEMRLVGGSGWGDELPAMVAKLADAGRPVTIERELSDLQLAEAYGEARFTVFPSLHEGYGLPVVESLAAGVPVITSSYGSTAQIGSEGGALLVDPRDDDALVAAMRTLLTDDATLERLRREAAGRPQRTWEEFATELWDGLVAPVLPAPPGSGC